ncbi:response regulator transcription factor [Sphingobacterium spiritivorum]|uniref:response regulator transcription factor n=1 Tax=Sphingobacterium spiritivorum TaxID=258 RepID=UPI003DA4EBE3
MDGQKHFLSDIWNNFPEVLSNKQKSNSSILTESIVNEMFCIGVSYYYNISIANGRVFNFHKNALTIHGLKSIPSNLQEIINLIHPEDLNFVLAAEEASLIKIQEIGFKHQLSLKTSYCFRMKIADGSYHLFHHQALHLDKDQNGGLVTAMNIHTDISHITHMNNYIVLISGIFGRDDYYQINLSPVPVKPCTIAILTRRETEILNLIAKGLSSASIASKLFISEQTVRVHRKNILRKVACKNSSELIKKSLEWGYIY